MHALLGAGDGGDVVALGQQPGQCDLRGGGADLVGDGCDVVGQAEVAGEVLLAEARVVGTEVGRVELVGGVDRAGQEPAPQGGEGTKPMSARAAPAAPRFGVAGEQGVLGPAQR